MIIIQVILEIQPKVVRHFKKYGYDLFKYVVDVGKALKTLLIGLALICCRIRHSDFLFKFSLKLKLFTFRVGPYVHL